MPKLKQGTLSFASTKRTNTNRANGKSQKKASTVEGAKNKLSEEEAYDGALPNEALEISSDEDSAVGETSVPAKRTRASTKTHASSRTTKRTSSQPSRSEEKEEPLEVTEREHLDPEDKAHRYRKYYNEVRAKMGYMEPIHSNGQNRIHQMLRFFDMSYEFGPCIGMPRLERWERAEALGLHPPVEVRDILLTKEGVEKAEYAQCVLYQEV